MCGRKKSLQVFDVTPQNTREMDNNTISNDIKIMEILTRPKSCVQELISPGAICNVCENFFDIRKQKFLLINLWSQNFPYVDFYDNFKVKP